MIAVLVNSLTAVGYFRQILPTWELYRTGNNVDMVLINDISLEVLSKYKVIHFHMNLIVYKPFRDIFDNLKLLGIRLIADIDDYWILPKTNPYYETHKVKNYIHSYINKIDCITTTTKRFRDELKTHTKTKIVVLPNACDSSNPQFKINKVESKKFRIGIIGGASHLYDLDVLAGFQDYLDMSDKQIVLCGFDTRGVDKPEFSIWNAFEQKLTNDYKGLPKEYVNHLLSYNTEEYPYINDMYYKRNFARDIESYASFYNEVDVLLAPLENSKFNNMKSELKAIEAGTMGVPIICSNVAPYSDILTNRENALLVGNSPEKWAKAINEVIKNYDKYRFNLMSLIDDNYNLHTINKKRIKLYDI